MPTLDWIGKQAVINHDREVPFHLLEEVSSFSVHPQSGEATHLLVEGDNLLALKALLPHYAAQVKCIYIDPPYNTGNESWIYNDNVNDPAIKTWLGQVVGKEAEDLSRHDKWLCMMYPRLKLLRDFLTPDGSLWVSIDDTECANLRLVLEEIFGPQNFVADVAWQRTYSTRNDAKGIVREVEHLLVFSRNPGWQPNELPRNAEMDSKYKNPDGDIAPWTSSDAFAADGIAHQGMVYAIQHPFTGKLIYPYAASHWRYSQDEMLEIMRGWGEYELRDLDDAAERAAVCGCAPEAVRAGVQGIVLAEPLEIAKAKAKAVYEAGLQQQKPWPRFYFTSGGKGGIRRKTYLEKVGGVPPTNLFPYEACGHTDEAKKELKALFGGQAPFDTPKPTRLLQHILRVASKPGDLVLDSFAGSGATGHAVLKENAANPGEPPRRCILVELLPKVAQEITAVRLRKAIAGYSFAKRDFPPCGGAFRYCRIGQAIFDEFGNIAPTVTYEQLAHFIWFCETGASASAPTIEGTCLGTAPDGREIHLLYAPQGEHRHTLLDQHFLREHPNDTPKVVYALAKLLPDFHLRQHQIVFRQLPYDLRKS